MHFYGETFFHLLPNFAIIFNSPPKLEHLYNSFDQIQESVYNVIAIFSNRMLHDGEDGKQ